ncbi:DUF3143 domain-containing protein [filamentous cyanobacterium LEGE 11480]|uniref:DUF3143 domain-containing protein n=1 Tax=Romeriopsis navalis LEGE 11480 TaxID=2777977 RepID=A0A928Z4B9_9CYAN|nr:DUF3143 domain-containing protein [Romeriopsis navalis]MBE9030872.1 DUF3143 domain-containing protein [Romeriopsis navalis LEGE 11480]
MQASNLPSADTALYNHPLPLIEAWLTAQGCKRDTESLHTWRIQQAPWQAEIELDVDQITVRYLNADASGQDLTRAFKYSLSREDIEAAIFAGP